MIIFLIVIGVLLYKIVECKDYIKKLERQIKMLKARIKELENNSLSILNTSENVINETAIQKSIINNEIENQLEYVPRSVCDSKSYREKKIEKKEKTDGRNVAILAVGAIFIVIAAISFLYASWDVLPNVLKSGVLLVLAVMFFGISNLAKKVFNLPQTSKTFYYIALGYVPIVLFSFSLFGLVGEFFSIEGEGKFIYLALTNFLVMCTYLFLAFKTDDIRLYYAGNIMQIITVIVSTFIFSMSIEALITVVLIYSVLINYLYGKFDIKFKVESIRYAEILALTISICGIITLPDIWGEFLSVIYALAIIINSIISFYKNKTEAKEICLLLSAFLFVLVCINLKISSYELPFIVKQIILIIYVLGSGYVYNFIVSEKVIRLVGNILNTIILTFLMFPMFEPYLPIWLVSLISFIIASIIYLRNRNEGIGIFITSLVLGYIALLLKDTTITYLVTLTESVCAILLLNKDKDKFVKMVPMLGFLPKLYTHELIVGNGFDFAIILNIAIIIIFTISNLKRRDISYVIASFIYLIGLLIKVGSDLNDYIITTILIIWGIVQLFGTNGVARDWIKVFIYTNALAMYMLLIEDIGINDITCICMIGVLVYAYAVIRGVIKKYNKEGYKIFEYLTYAIVYIWAFNLYSGVLDFTLFIGMILGIIIISYLKKMGPAFLCSMIALVWNMLYISRDFWLNIPWWAYLVVVGGILISFAVRNEISERKENVHSLKEKLTKVKDFLDI